MAVWLKYLTMFGLAMVPVSELRGAIPLGLAYGIPWYECYILCCIANFIPVPFILLLIKKVIKWMAESKVEFFKKVSLWIQNKADKNKDKVNRYMAEDAYNGEAEVYHYLEFLRDIGTCYSVNRMLTMDSVQFRFP